VPGLWKTGVGDASKTAGSASRNAVPGCPVSAHASCPPNTRDKLRGAHDPTMALGGSEPVAAHLYHAPLRLHPPLVSFIALFDGAVALCTLPLRWPLRR